MHIEKIDSILSGINSTNPVSSCVKELLKSCIDAKVEKLGLNLLKKGNFNILNYLPIWEANGSNEWIQQHVTGKDLNKVAADLNYVRELLNLLGAEQTQQNMLSLVNQYTKATLDENADWIYTGLDGCPFTEKEAKKFEEGLQALRDSARDMPEKYLGILKILDKHKSISSSETSCWVILGPCGDAPILKVSGLDYESFPKWKEPEEPGATPSWKIIDGPQGKLAGWKNLPIAG